jgi:hypothetical protein
MKWFGREPALYLTGVLAALQLLAVLAKLPADQQNALSVGATAVFGLLLAAFTRPLDTAALTGGIATLATAAGVFGFDVPADVVSAFNAALVSVLTLLLTMRVSPAPTVSPPERP